MTAYWWKRKGRHKWLASLRKAKFPLRAVGDRLLPGSLALLLALLTPLEVQKSLEGLAYVALFQIRGDRPWSDRIVVVEIDDATLDQLGQYPLSRQRYTDLINILAPAEPTTIIFDLLFTEETPEDTRLAEIIASNGRIALAQSWDTNGKPLLPVSALREAAIGSGHAYHQTDEDGLVRQILPEKNGVPALGIVAAQVYSLVYAPVALPDIDEVLWLNWPGTTQTIERYSLTDILNRQIPLTQFRNKIVLVGVTASTLDKLQTPFDRNPPTSGVFLQATVIDNLLQQSFLRPFPSAYSPLLFLVLGVGFSGLLPRRGIVRQLIVWVVTCLGWLGLALGLFWDGYWLPIVLPVTVFTLTLAAVVLIEQRRTNQLLRESEERYALAVRGSNEGLWDWNLTTQTIYFSPRWNTMLGDKEPCSNSPDSITMQRSTPQEWFSRVHPDDIDKIRTAIQNHLNGQTPFLEHEYRILHQDGTYRWMLCRGLAVSRADGEPYRIVGSQTDITARKQAEEQLRLRAFYDELTGLPNRALLLEKLREAIAFTQKFPGTTFAVLWIDLDRFKVVNNSLGNAIGDRLLVATAQRLRSFLAEEDVVARMSGDEFTILLTQIQETTDATRMADRVQQLLSLPFNLDGNEVYTTVSIGIVVSSLLYTQPEHLLRDADTAMHRAKVLGRARYQVFDTAMRTRMVERLQLENDLRRAISIHPFGSSYPELFLHYQPIIHLNSNKATGFEALVRWKHPEQGVISPGRFIPMAEETGLIVDMGWWVFQEACRQMRLWRLQFGTEIPLTININLSSKQFALPGLTEQIRQVLEDTGLDPCCLKLEITESTVMENASAVVGVLHQLRGLGIQLAIDDFGTGYSSLSYLPRFPINTIKIDRSFVSKMGRRSDELEIVRTILVLAQNLGMDAVAEGVETAYQAAQLLALNCEYGQGFYFAKPLDATAATTLLQKNYTPPEED